MLYSRTRHLKSGAARKLSWPERLRKLQAETVDPRLQAFYQAGWPDPETPMAEVPMVAMDFETTGLSPVDDSIVSIGLLPFELARIRVAGAHHWLLRPQVPLHPTSVTIHGITHSDIEDAPDIDEVLDEILSVMAGRIAVVHYRHIERPFLDVALQARLGEGIQFPVIDTIAIESYLHPKRSPGWWAQWVQGKKPISVRLPDCRVRYRLPHYPPHNALTDALATAELLQAQIQHHFSPETPLADLWL
ncbi:3'-5' exonuclease [Marinobacter sp. X15-166B]|uniref:3'-5' exonuclease n=1 Tax=Marinobacter sp. X15-166B TaxID=1897620 RepID=UPI00085BD24F|nr:3'-5' exonuclease [Marinobacter sp. X15-166B]OEY66230.1 DNA polymerase III subunit epsilon [Marinobacter sp. X15-166B]